MKAIFCFFASVCLCAPVLGKPVYAASVEASAFEQALAQVYLQHPKLAAQREDVRILDERVSQANAGFRPTVAANAARGRQRVDVEDQVWQYGEDASVSLAVTQPLFNGFGTLAQRRGARERVRAGRSLLLATEQKILFTAIGAWLDVCEKEKMLSLNQDNLHRMYRYLEATRQRFQEGDGTVTDIALSESRLAEAEVQLAMAEANRDVSRAAYERETGLLPSVADFPPLPESLPKNREEAAAGAQYNPEMQQAYYTVRAADYDIDSASSSLWPSVFLRGNMSEERSTAFGLDKLRNDSITLNVSIPLYQGGAEYSRVREAKLTREKNRHNALDVSRAIKEQSEASWSNYYAAGKIIQASQRSVQANLQALGGIEEEQAQGTRSLTEVLEAQTDLLAAQLAEVQAQKTLRLEAYRLMAATGKLTAEGLHLPVSLYDPQKHYDRTAGRWAGTSIEQDQQSANPGS